MKIVEMSIPGQAYAAHIHAQGCADIRKEKGRGYTDSWEMDINGPDWLADTFGDIASDSYKVDTQDWREELLFQAAEVVVAPCAHKLGFVFPPKKETKATDTQS